MVEGFGPQSHHGSAGFHMCVPSPLDKVEEMSTVIAGGRNGWRWGYVASSPAGTSAERRSLRLCVLGGNRKVKGSRGISTGQAGRTWLGEVVSWCNRNGKRRWFRAPVSAARV